ncbi:MAG: hypothetical protein V4564_01400 [Pseudomonadota bacterium]|uniref:hypothetical protein n=1 Tax=Sphingomonas sp. ERG5 TaxID=1381597 RepID=UPI00126A02A5|nr:hypothetical protein [Sphingomonas sp. ERG5]
MFFISWGSKGAVADVGPAGDRHCDRCNHDGPFTRMVAYRVRHVYWLFRWVTDRTPYLLCGNCGSEYLAGDDDHDVKEERAAIPFWDRRGWTIGLGAIGSVVAMGTIAAAADNVADSGYVLAPHVGDIYEVDLAKMTDKPEARVMRSAMRVTGVKGGSVEMAVANLYYNDWRGVDRDISSGKAAQADYYAPEHAIFPLANLKRMRDDGVVYDIRR